MHTIIGRIPRLCVNCSLRLFPWPSIDPGSFPFIPVFLTLRIFAIWGSSYKMAAFVAVPALTSIILNSVSAQIAIFVRSELQVTSTVEVLFMIPDHTLPGCIVVPTNIAYRCVLSSPHRFQKLTIFISSRRERELSLRNHCLLICSSTGRGSYRSCDYRDCSPYVNLDQDRSYSS